MLLPPPIPQVLEGLSKAILRVCVIKMCSGIFAHLDSFISESIGIISIREN